MKWAALAVLGLNLVLALVLAFGDEPAPPPERFPESGAPPILLLSEVASPAPEPTPTPPPEADLQLAAAPEPPAPTAPPATAPQDPPSEPAPHTAPAPEPSAEAEPSPPPAPAATTQKTAPTQAAAPELPDLTPPKPPKPATRTYCYRIGPIHNRRDLATVRARLRRTMGDDGRTESQKVPVISGYWVFIPPQELSQAEATARQLRRRGIQDLYVLREGDYKGAVSLGLYSRRVTAEKRQRQLAKRGIETRLEPRYKPGHRYWIELSIEARRPPSPQAWQAVERGIPGLRHRRKDCA